MIFRLLLTAGVFTLGYLVGREVGKTEHIRQELAADKKDKDSVSTSPESAPATRQRTTRKKPSQKKKPA